MNELLIKMSNKIIVRHLLMDLPASFGDITYVLCPKKTYRFVLKLDRGYDGEALVSILTNESNSDISFNTSMLLSAALTKKSNSAKLMVREEIIVFIKFRAHIWEDLVE